MSRIVIALWLAAIPCWCMAAYYTIRFNAAFSPVLRSDWVFKGLSPRMAIFWADDPPECRVLRLKMLKWGGAFCALLIAGALLSVF